MNFPSNDKDYIDLKQKLKSIMYSDYSDIDKLCLIEELIKYD